MNTKLLSLSVIGLCRAASRRRRSRYQCDLVLRQLLEVSCVLLVLSDGRLGACSHALVLRNRSLRGGTLP